MSHIWTVWCSNDAIMGHWKTFPHILKAPKQCHFRKRHRFFFQKKGRKQPLISLRHQNGTTFQRGAIFYLFCRKTVPSEGPKWCLFLIRGTISNLFLKNGSTWGSILENGSTLSWGTIFFPKHDYEENTRSLGSQRSHFPKRILWGTSLAPLFFSVHLLVQIKTFMKIRHI